MEKLIGKHLKISSRGMRKMIKFKNYDEYIEKTRQALERKLKNLNCFLLPEKIKQLIDEGILYYLEDENVFEIIVKNDEYYKVSFYSNDNFKFLNFDSDRPIITDLPYSNDMNDKVKKIATLFEKEGFAVNCKSSRMIKNDFNVPNFKYNTNVTIDSLSDKTIDAVVDIWQENFDKIQDLLYSKRELMKYADNIYVLKDEESNVIGAAEITIESGSGMISKIAIDKSYHGKGYGSFLEIFYINYCKMLGLKRLLLYTIDDNISAQNFHKKFGFVEDGKHNCQYIFKNIKEKIKKD